MIHYQLCCAAEHAFEGWFKNSAAFDQQSRAGMLECPECGTPKVRRALMAPSLTRRGRHPAPRPDEAQPVSQPAPATDRVIDQSGRPDTPSELPAMTAAVMPDQVRAVLQKLRAEVERNCEHVGSRFAEEARAIHRGDTEPRGIYGESTPEQAEALADEGIAISRIPWVPRADG